MAQLPSRSTLCSSTNFLKNGFPLLQIMLPINVCYGRT
jgi:hypothetical protein